MSPKDAAPMSELVKLRKRQRILQLDMQELDKRSIAIRDEINRKHGEEYTIGQKLLYEGVGTDVLDAIIDGNNYELVAQTWWDKLGTKNATDVCLMLNAPVTFAGKNWSGLNESTKNQLIIFTKVYLTSRGEGKELLDI